MSSNRIFPTIAIAVALFLGACSNSSENILLWGETLSFEPFLWKKQVPDTLKQTLCFEFNADAVNHMSSPLVLGLFKKTDDGMLCQVPAEEMELFVNGQVAKDGQIIVRPTDRAVEVGVVFNHNAENKMHYWYLKPIKTAGLERINDKESYSADEAIMEIKLNKRHVMNPLAKGLTWIGIFILAALLLWFLCFKQIIYPTFRVTRLLLTGPEPYFSQLRVKGYRMCILSATPPKQNWLNRIFTGAIKYETNAVWTAPIVIEPRDKTSVRITPDKQTFTTDARIMRINTDYVIVNETTKAKTIAQIS